MIEERLVRRYKKYFNFNGLLNGLARFIHVNFMFNLLTNIVDLP